MVANRTRTKRQKIIDGKLKIDQLEPHRPQKKMSFQLRGLGESLRKYLMTN